MSNGNKKKEFPIDLDFYNVRPRSTPFSNTMDILNVHKDNY